MKDYVEVNDKKCCEVDNCMCVKYKNGKKYCMGCGNVVPARKDKYWTFQHLAHAWQSL